MSAGWHEQRFTEDPRKLRYDCTGCGRGMWFPASKHGKYKTCGTECSEAVRAKVMQSRTRQCLTCGGAFVPRPGQVRAGQGKYCSNGCTEPVLAAGRTPEAAAKRGQKRREQYAAGLWQPLRGAANPRWTGGKDAYKARQKSKSVERTATRRAYLKANPEKAREWRQKRRGLGRLPRGTVQRIGSAQMWKCAACRVSVRHGYHLDHVMPLALGGEHAPSNLQLLCGPCNVRKWAKHPVDFMQSRGFLL